jgi:hypothetical protein
MSKTELQISPDFSLPLEAATRRMAILAMSGAGKSNAAVVLAEQMFDAGIPWVAVDPKGDWFGVRSDVTGKKAGLPIPIFGGLHGDVPLEPTAGKLMGELVAEHRLTCVLDVSEFESRQDLYRFMLDFASALLKKNKAPLHLFLDEADEYIPQTPGEKGYGPKCLGAWQRLVKRGRFRGIGATIITQRSTAINKDVVSMAEALIAMRMTWPADLKRIREWMMANGVNDIPIESLSSLENGECWICSPQWLRTKELVQFNQRRTFDSGKTPEIGESVEPATLANIDLKVIEQEIAATLEKAKSEDPRELNRRIAELERQLDHETQHFDAKETQEDRNLLAHCEALEAADGRFEDENKKLREQNDWFREHLAHIEKKAEEVIHACDLAGEIEAIPSSAEHYIDRDRQPTERSKAAAFEGMKAAGSLPPKVYDYSSGTEVVTTAKLNVSNNGHAKITKPQQRILQALRSMEPVGFNAVSKPFTAVLAGASPASGAYANNLSALRTAGLLDYPRAGYLALTDHGRDQTEPVDLPWLRTIPRSLIENLTETQAKILMEVVASKPHSAPTLSEYQTAWLSKVSNPQRRILEHLISIYPQSVDKESLAASAGASATSGAYANNLSYLRSSCGLIDYPQQGYVVATELLFPDGLR